MCDGTDRFRFDDIEGRGTWICNKCGAGDGFSLAMRVNSWDFKEVTERVGALIGKVERHIETRKERSEKSLREAMNRLWTAGAPIGAGDTVARYLESRGIRMSKWPAALRYVEKCRYQADDPIWFPAMIAKVTGADGKPVTVHRTYLASTGGKAQVEAPRRLMPGKIDKGCAIRLGEAGKVLGIAEGIETALSASQIWNVPCWAAVNAGMLMAWEPPAGTEEVIIFGDNDPGYAGQSAAFALAHRIAVRGLKVRVEIPSDVGLDWNDVLQAERIAA